MKQYQLSIKPRYPVKGEFFVNGYGRPEKATFDYESMKFQIIEPVDKSRPEMSPVDALVEAVKKDNG